MSAHLRLYRIALRALPARVVEGSREDMVRTFEQVVTRARARGRVAAHLVAAAEVVNVLVVGVSARAAASGVPSLPTLFRSLLRRRAYGLGVAATLALGVGAAGSVYAVTREVALRGLPFPDAERLVHVWGNTPGEDNPIPTVGGSTFLAWREMADVFERLEGVHRDTRVITGDGPPEQISVAVVTPGLLPLLGVTPLVGRGFQGAEGYPGSHAFVLISYELWTRRYRQDLILLGRTIELNGERTSVLGVLPRGFRFPDRDTDAWLPVAPVPSALRPAEGQPAVPGLDVLGRLTPSVDREKTNDLFRTRERELAAAGATESVPRLYDLEYFNTPERTRRTLILLLWAVGLVLLVAGANVVALALSHAADRWGETAVREALGAGRGRLFVDLFAENLVLAVAGVAAGLALAEGLIEAFLPLVPQELGVNTWGRRVSTWPGGFAPAALAAVLVATAMTALTRVGRVAGGRRLVGLAIQEDTRGSNRVQQLLLAGQMGLATVLLAGVSLVAASVVRLNRVDVGMDADQLLAVSLRIPTAAMLGAAGGSTPPTERAALFEARFAALEEALGRVPGVTSVASTTSPLPLTRARFRATLETPGRQPRPIGDTTGLTGAAFAGTQFLPMSEVAPGFFRTAGIPLVEGRDFAPTDDPRGTVIVNQVLARRLWGEASPVGRLLRITERDPWLTVVGVAAPVVQMSLRDQMGEGAEIYVPLDRGRMGVYRTFLLRTDGRDPGSMVEQVRSTVWGISPTQPIERLEPLRAAYESTTNRERFFLELLAVFSALTTLLAAAGVYALLSRYLARRRREVAIRIALGAAPGQVAAHFAQSSLVPSAAGVVLGAAVTLPLSRVLGDLLFQTRPGEPLAVALTAATLLAVAALACVHPVRRALRTDVVEAVRGE